MKIASQRNFYDEKLSGRRADNFIFLSMQNNYWETSM